MLLIWRWFLNVIVDAKVDDATANQDFARVARQQMRQESGSTFCQNAF
jgi:hypothetical protein